ncbi:hypothetical protein SISNIDRAFT_486740 [Sistotremastrum niveocremeum HHB9708]|uniref:F-box domain-containing protein n=1 Tax=Sistotremastrum niveocremeum HHB9708 TaxID=1314777 RepID=A0A164TAD6_9AGAM|nr:hypothetical protein SISNIDRAFT_486740 [Sistotremastrum niveocremeum HHB9708]
MGRPRVKKAKTLRQGNNKSGLPDATVSEIPVTRKYNPSLPPEIVAMIVGDVVDEFDEGQESEEARQLCILARSSRQLQAEAERRLYQSVEFMVGEINAQKLAAILRSRTAGYVRTLMIGNYGAVRRRGRTASRAVSALPFSLMTGLRSLYLSIDHDIKLFITTDLDPEVFLLLDRDLPPNILRRFVCSLPLLPSFLQFLKRQTSIEFISSNFTFADTTAPDVVLSHATHPNLTEIQSLQLDRNVLSIMDHTRIQKLRIFGSFHLPQNWASYAANLVRLDAMTWPMDLQTLSKVVRCSPQLQVLIFAILPGLEQEPAPLIFDLLGSLKKLKVCALVSVLTGQIPRAMLKGCYKCEALESFVFVTKIAGYEMASKGIEPKTGVCDNDWIFARYDDFDLLEWALEQDDRITKICD